MTRALNQLAFMTPMSKPADEWARDKAAEMHAAGYAPGPIIQKLEAYGVGFHSAQAVVRKLQEERGR